ncbi:MAG TPA: amino acid permease [Bacteroidales bacterium]|nr:amino acid permease [Bacteroidales bacterium]
MANNFFVKKSVDELISQTEEGEHKLKRALGSFDLVLLGIGAIIGTGIFVLTGVGAALHAGPAVTLSFAVSAIACIFAALCYAEFASIIPVSGSAYTYAYATIGELLAWIIGWDLILEYAVCSITVAIGWSGYLVNLMASIGIIIPVWMTQPPFNLPALIIVIIITTLLVIGIKESARFNNFIVIVKLAVILFFIAFGAFFIKPENWNPFMPFGWTGVMTGAAIVFFAYIGFDAVSTTAEETKNPQRNLPIGIIVSLIVCSALYIIVALVLTGIIPVMKYADNQSFLSAPIAFALNVIHQDWASGIISIGAVMGITSVLLVMMMGQPRVFFAMSRDRLFPESISKVHPKFRTPYRTTIITGVVVGLVALLIPIGTAAELANIGTLFAFAIVSASVLILRRSNPEIKRSFRVPIVYVFSPLGVLSSLYLMYSLPVLTWIRFLAWLDLGLFIYYFYSRFHSRLAEKAGIKITFHWKDMLEFFGIFAFINGLLFGLLSLLAKTGMISMKSWNEINLNPDHTLVPCLLLIIAGSAMYLFGRIRLNGIKKE